MVGGALGGGAAGSPQTYRAGESAELQIQSGPYAGFWVPCSITGLGQATGLYNLHVPSAPEGQRDFPDVPATQMRKGELSSWPPRSPRRPAAPGSRAAGSG